MNYRRNQPVLIIFFFILANILAILRCQDVPKSLSWCYPYNGNVTVNSTYQTNLQSLLNSLPPQLDDNGFYFTSVGHDTDTVNAMAICRTDTQLDTCHTCVQNATDAVLQECFLNKKAFRYSELYWLRYSNIPTFNYNSSYVAIDIEYRNVNVSADFVSDLNILLRKIIPQASAGGSLRKIAVDNQSTSNSLRIYALVQCMPNLSQEECLLCLNQAAQRLSTCCGGAKLSLIVHMDSCYIRYADRPFYNETRLLELEARRTMLPTAMSSPTFPPPRLGPPAFTGTLMIIALAASLLIRRKRSLNHQASKTHNSEAQSFPSPPPATAGYADLLRLKFDEIRVATNDFSKELGRGAFGAVFWGKLPGGREIAVKRLEIGSNQGEREFKAEVSILAQLKHRNLVTLIGFSSEGEEKLLVYEYVENGCLSKFLFDRTECPNLDWKTRYNIIEGIVKDFGLARLIELDETHCSTNKVAGTPGYIAPEYQFLHQISMKSDVFSFGVLLLEIISGQKNSRHGHLTSRAWDAWETRTVENLVDPVLLKDASSMLGTILRCIHIGLLCVQPKASDRPSITSIATMLNSPSMLLPEPSNNGFYTEFHSVESQ